MSRRYFNSKTYIDFNKLEWIITFHCKDKFISTTHKLVSYVYTTNARQIRQINNSHIETKALEKNQLNYTEVKNVNKTVPKDVEIVDAGSVLWLCHIPVRSLVSTPFANN